MTRTLQHCFLLLAVSLPIAIAQNAPATLAAGLESPFKLALTPARNLLVGETGEGPNAGRITLVNRSSGAKSVLINGLPSVSTTESRESITGMIAQRRTIYALVGEGDVVISGPTPGTQIPNPKVAASPIFSSLLALRFSVDIEDVNAPFTLTPQHQVRLADGVDVELDNGAGARLNVQLVANFADVHPDPITIGRASHPFGMDFARGNPNFLYIADSGQNKLLRVDLRSGRTRTMATFPPIPNRTGFGPPVSDVVPTSVRAYGNQLLVTYLSGFPFAPAAGGAYLVNPVNGEWQPFLTNHTTVMDVLVREQPNSDRPQFFVLEFSGNLLAQPPLPGRLLQYTTQQAEELQPGLVNPVSMVMDRISGEIYISELATGRIVKVTPR